MRLAVAAIATFLLVSCASAQVRGQIFLPTPEDRTHNSEEWADIAAHLPDQATASAPRLELAADVLRARRYPHDAMAFYDAAIVRGGDPSRLLNKMGITCLEAQQVTLARLMFQRAIHLNKRDASAWNNLGAADFTLHNTMGAISDYKHALKLNKSSAPFHSNLALAYFDAKDADDGRHELARALRLDPDLLHKGSNGGYTAQVLATTNYSQICFEMARIYASQHNVEAMLDWLTKATERGYDVRAAMDHDATLRPLLSDPRVRVILKNGQMLRAGSKPPASIPPLDAPEH